MLQRGEEERRRGGEEERRRGGEGQEGEYLCDIIQANCCQWVRRLRVLRLLDVAGSFHGHKGVKGAGNGLIDEEKKMVAGHQDCWVRYTFHLWLGN